MKKLYNGIVVRPCGDYMRELIDRREARVKRTSFNKLNRSHPIILV